MQYTFETDAYNERRYGKPWMARVKTSLTANFEWIDWNGRAGQRGDFTFDAQPGEIIAEGQKDNRKGRGGVDGYRVLLPDGDSILTHSLAIPDGKLLAMPLEMRWKYAVRERLDVWMEKKNKPDSEERWRLVAQYSKLLGIPNPLMAQAAQALGLTANVEWPADPTQEANLRITIDNFFFL